jgi:uncharacterized repeat protein (TIGR04076 family)
MMHKTIAEDWEFVITVIDSKRCGMGFEKGDSFHCTYDCPTGFCPKTMANLHRLCDIARAGGDYKLLGGKSKNEIDFCCADGCVNFRLTAKHID